MYKKRVIQVICSWFFVTTSLTIAQETSADISNEENPDAFQEYFYESLKQKGIENYDKAITALLECKQLDPNNHVIDYELGLNYLYQQQYMEAQGYLETAISMQPDNKWYLDALLKCYKAQHAMEKAIQLAGKLAKDNPEYYMAMADLYMEQREFDKALETLDKMAEAGGNPADVKQKRAKVLMFKNVNALDGVEDDNAESKSVDNPVEAYRQQILRQLQKTDYNEMLSVSSEALDNYPTQPEFYYLKGMALNKLQKYKMAVDVLEEGLDYIIDDNTLRNNIYNELVFAYKGLNNPEKTKVYQQKIDADN
ncbi:tetratricopeptide repeat protein [Galbibacter sp. PAP.153]|uniref:tetratricopeptide repeat protein n=1 Tax=Galbibacter sp. PAP.153 TaxID=3104623 RepID=UPI00300BD379